MTFSRGKSYSRGFASGQQLLRTALRALPSGFLELLPAHRRTTGLHLDHGDAAGHGADQRAQIAAHTLIFQNVWNMPELDAMAQITARTLFHANALVRAVFASDITKIAANA